MTIKTQLEIIFPSHKKMTQAKEQLKTSQVNGE